MGDKVVKRNNGRLGKGHGQQVVHTVRRAFDAAINNLETRGKPLPLLMADALEQDVLAGLNTIARFMPRDVDVQVSGNFADALSQAAEIIRSENAYPIVIEEEKEKKEQE
jgi:hypothetical protein